MQIVNSTAEDLPVLLQLYDKAREYQRQHSTHHWKLFEPEQVLQEISEGLQWKILEDDKIACVFLTTYSDPFIWGERDKEPSVYLHRIVTNPDFRGKKYVPYIIEWARQLCKQRGLKNIRMDTWGDNLRLNEYYVQCGLTLLEIITPETKAGMPSYYNFDTLSLLEMKIE